MNRLCKTLAKPARKINRQSLVTIYPKRTYASFNFISKSHNITTLKIVHNDMNTLFEELSNKINTAPSFYDNMPVVLEFENQDVDSKYLKQLLKKIKKINIHPVAITQTSDSIKVCKMSTQ